MRLWVEPAGGEQKSADVERKTVMLIYPLRYGNNRCCEEFYSTGSSFLKVKGNFNILTFFKVFCSMDLDTMATEPLNLLNN